MALNLTILTPLSFFLPPPYLSSVIPVLSLYLVYIILLCNHHFCEASVSFKISRFFSSCPVLKKDNVIKHLYIVLSCLIK